MKQQIQRFMIRALARFNGTPMSEEVLLAECKLVFSGPTEADLKSALQGLESGGYVIGTQAELAGRFWTLTTKGALEAGKLG